MGTDQGKQNGLSYCSRVLSSHSDLMVTAKLIPASDAVLSAWRGNTSDNTLEMWWRVRDLTASEIPTLRSMWEDCNSCDGGKLCVCTANTQNHHQGNHKQSYTQMDYHHTEM